MILKEYDEVIEKNMICYYNVKKEGITSRKWMELGGSHEKIVKYEQ